MTATKLYIDTLDLNFTPTGGSELSILKISQTSLDYGIENINFKGDGDQYRTYQGVVNQVPTLSIQGGNVNGMLAPVAGAIGALEWIWADADNGIVSGSYAMSWVMDGAIPSTKNTSNPHANLASANLAFTAQSSDGETNPLGLTIL